MAAQHMADTPQKRTPQRTRVANALDNPGIANPGLQYVSAKPVYSADDGKEDAVVLQRDIHEAVCAALTGNAYTTRDCYRIGPAYRSVLTAIMPCLAHAYALANSNIPGRELRSLKQALGHVHPGDYAEQEGVCASFLDHVSSRVLSRLRLICIRTSGVTVYPSDAQCDMPMAHSILLVYMHDGSVRLAWGSSSSGHFKPLFADDAWATLHNTEYTPAERAYVRNYAQRRTAREPPLADKTQRAMARKVKHAGVTVVPRAPVRYPAPAEPVIDTAGTLTALAHLARDEHIMPLYNLTGDGRDVDRFARYRIAKPRVPEPSKTADNARFFGPDVVRGRLTANLSEGAQPNLDNLDTGVQVDVVPPLPERDTRGAVLQSVSNRMRDAWYDNDYMAAFFVFQEQEVKVSVAGIADRVVVFEAHSAATVRERLQAVLADVKLTDSEEDVAIRSLFEKPQCTQAVLTKLLDSVYRGTIRFEETSSLPDALHMQVIGYGVGNQEDMMRVQSLADDPPMADVTLPPPLDHLKGAQRLEAYKTLLDHGTGNIVGNGVVPYLRGAVRAVQHPLLFVDVSCSTDEEGMTRGIHLQVEVLVPEHTGLTPEQFLAFYRGAYMAVARTRDSRGTSVWHEGNPVAYWGSVRV